MTARVVFFLLLILAGCGLASPPAALAAGIVFGAIFKNPYVRGSQQGSQWLLQISVVALGFGINLGQVIHTGRASLVYTAISISLAMLLGLCLGNGLRVPAKASLLIAAGTAICGGSAIAAIAPITKPDDEELAMSMGTVFTLNSIALFLFPILGSILHLTQNQFGLWAALAIHDTSSVVGATAKFGPQALAIGTVVKLTRALWIIPVAIIVAVASRSKTRVKLPWFILLFCLAAAAKSYLPQLGWCFAGLSWAGHAGLAITLFLVGSGINAGMIKKAGARVILQGSILWAIMATGSLIAISSGWVAL